MRTFACPCVTTLLVVCAVLVAASGCAKKAPVAASLRAAKRTTKVEVVNLSDYDWRLAVVSKEGREVAASRLVARGTLRLEVPGGDYEIEQTAINGTFGPGATRRFSAHLETGESYRWRLATLLAAPTGAAP